MEEGWDDELVGGVKEDIEYDLTNLPLSGANSIFIKRLQDGDPDLFVKKPKKVLERILKLIISV